jgi:hypothetical protein
VARISKDPKATAPKPPEKAARPARGDKDAPAAKDDAGAAKRGPKVPFPRKNQMPTEAEFLARLPAATGKRFDGVRTFLKKQKGVTEDLFFYGPKTGWAYRYLRGTHSLATVMIHDERLVGIVSLDTEAMAMVDFHALSDVGARARKLAHGSPSLMWLDLPLDGPGAGDFKTLLKAKLKAQPARPPSPPVPPVLKGRGSD